MATTVLIADDHPLFRQALALAVQRVVPDVHLMEA
jgi:DNA-binding NarL/FixJ family response regulator